MNEFYRGPHDNPPPSSGSSAATTPPYVVRALPRRGVWCRSCCREDESCNQTACRRCGSTAITRT